MSTTTPATAASNNNKKRKSGAKNPLSNARRSSSNHNFYQDLWHKKTGLGFTLFLQYYGQQPRGCCSVSAEDDDDDCDENKRRRMADSLTETTVASSSVGVLNSSPSMVTAATATTTTSNTSGMSRAAKRRRKRKGPTSTATQEKGEEPEMQQTSALPFTFSSNITSPSPSSSHRLLQELNKHPSYSHLLPFLQAMSKPLPLTFRLRNIRHYDDNETLTKYYKTVQAELQALQEYCAPASWDAAIYQTHPSLQMHKSMLGKACPALKELLVRASSQGILARQELGSMLPVLGLHRGKHLKTNARVLDLCASPGSKTLQALEVVGPKGRVVANDVHPKRLETLQEAVQRSGIPLLDRLVFTNYDAAVFPKTLAQQDQHGSTKTLQQQQRPHVVLCDVPCSGDGTIRKDPTVLPGWSPVAARALHDLQCRILRRALEVVQVGGVVSYSTCSLNPVENEAVVQTVLGLHNDHDDAENKDNPDAVEVLEWPQMDGLTLRPGLTNWKVLDFQHDVVNDEEDESHNNDVADGQWKDYASYSEAKDTMSHCYPTLWPGPKNEALRRCRRLWPQDQDTGGFFVALLRKNAELPISKKHCTVSRNASTRR